MNKRLIEELIPIAIDALKTPEIKIVDNNTISNVYKGYIASFGTSVVQAGLRQSVAFFSVKGAATQEEEGRLKIMNLICKVLRQAGKIDVSVKTLGEYVNDAETDQSKAKGYILDAAVACKMAIRSYKIVKKNRG